MNRHYAWRGGSEHLRRQGETRPIQVLILPALFDEANRMRRFMVMVMHNLVEAGIGAMLPDLPGTGESERDPASVTAQDWQDAVRSVAALMPPGLRRTVAIRGGALLDRFATAADVPHAAWRLSPETGARLLRDLHRTRLAGPQTATGYPIGADLRAFLDAAVPEGPARTIRLATERQSADHTLDGAPLWRRAEPGEDAALVARVAADIVAWAHACAA